VASASSASTTVTMSAPQSVTANFSAVSVVTATLTPASLSSTAVTGATTAAQVATLSNSGNAPLAISGITIAGANPTDFNQTNTRGTTPAAGYNLTLSTYTAGARYLPQLGHASFQPFGQVLIGMAHSAGTLIRG